MHTGMVLISGAVLVLIGFALLGGPMFLVDWSLKRRQTVIERQVALTDAIDGQIGPTVAAVVRKSLFGPWEIQIAVPVHQSAMVARILSVVDEVFPDIGGEGSLVYRIFLAARPDSPRAMSASPTPRLTKPWTGDQMAAA